MPDVADYSELLRSCVNAVHPVSESAFEQIYGLTDIRAVTGDALFIRRDRPDRYEYFLLEGICRSFLLNPDGREVTISFFQSPGILSPHSIRTQENRSIFDFQALSAVVLGRLDAEAFMQLMVRHPEVRQFGNAVMRRELQQKVDKEVYLASRTAKERLIHFRNQFAGLENRVPHAHIASYLGITNVSLSRLRRELTGR